MYIYNPNLTAEWIFVQGKELPGKDVHEIAKWNKNYSIADLLQKVYENGWSGVVIVRDSVDNRVSFKKVNFQLLPEHLTPNDSVEGTWIYLRENAEQFAAVAKVQKIPS